MPTGYNEFMSLFGGLTISNLAIIIMAGVFFFKVYTKWSDHLYKKRKTEEQRDKDLKEALTEVRKYPEYRKQSLKIQAELEQKNANLGLAIDNINKKLNEMEEATKRRETNKTKDRLWQLYYHYTDLNVNPTQSWTRAESDVFWDMFRDYELDGGNGDVHHIIQPAMLKLKVID